MSREAFNARLAAEREAGAKSVLKDLGVEKAEDAKARLAEDAKRREAEKTELQRAQEQAKEAETLRTYKANSEAAIKRLLEAETKAVPESKKGLLDLAPPETDPVARLDWMARAKERGMFTDAAPATTTQGEKKPANPATTAGPNGPTPPKPAGTLTAYEQHQALLAKGQTVPAAQFEKAHRKAIEASRPK